MLCFPNSCRSTNIICNEFIILLILSLLLWSCGESSKPIEENVEAVEAVEEPILVPEEKEDKPTSVPDPAGKSLDKAIGEDLGVILQPDIAEGVIDNGALPETPSPIVIEKGDSTISGPQVALEDYKAVLEVDKNIKLHQNARLVVWIGDEGIEYVPDESAAVDTEVFPARIGQYAKVRPIAPDFEIAPVETGCIRIDPSGSKVEFTLRAIEEGTFEVSAEIQLYDNPNCEGTPVPKTTEHLSVTVEVDKDYRWKHRFKKLGEIFWDKFFSFWGALVALVLGFLIYIIRKFLKNRSGFEGEE